MANRAGLGHGDLHWHGTAKVSPHLPVSSLYLGPGGPWMSRVQVSSQGSVAPGPGSKSHGLLLQVRLLSRNSLGPLLREGPEVPGSSIKWSSDKRVCSKPRRGWQGWPTVWGGSGQARHSQGCRPAVQGCLHALRPLGTEHKRLAADLSKPIHKAYG